MDWYGTYGSELGGRYGFVGEEVGPVLVASEAQEDGDNGNCSGPGGDAEVVEISEKMVARFVQDVSDDILHLDDLFGFC